MERLSTIEYATSTYETEEDLLSYAISGKDLKKISYAIDYEYDKFGHCDITKIIYDNVLNMVHSYLDNHKGEYELGFTTIDSVDMYTAVRESIQPQIEEWED